MSDLVDVDKTLALAKLLPLEPVEESNVVEVKVVAVGASESGSVGKELSADASVVDILGIMIEGVDEVVAVSAKVGCLVSVVVDKIVVLLIVW